jgi:predicted acetyltransferase
MSVEKRYLDLVKKYSKIKDEILEFTKEYYDGMLYDIEGYLSIDEEDYGDYLQDLENQVNACKLLKKSLQKINYIFG